MLPSRANRRRILGPRCCPATTLQVELRSAKLNVVTVIAVGDMFGIEGGREQLAAVLERFERDAQREPGCRRYTFAATVTDPAQFVFLSEWESQDALDAHYRSQMFADFQFDLQGLLARPSELTIYATDRAVRPQDTSPMDPRDAD